MPVGSPSVWMDKRFSGDTVTSDVATRFGSAALVAVTVILVEPETLGAVNKPVLLTLPALACHETAVLLVEVKVEENWTCPPDATLALAGNRFIWTAWLFVDGNGAAEEMPAQPVPRLAAMDNRLIARSWLRCRRAVLLVWKPGDDSKNIFALTN